MRKIAVFGSAFNPPSLGHKDVIESLAHFDLILLVPSIAHAWGKSMLDYAIRCKLVERFIADLDMHKVELCTLEQDIVRQGESVTTFQLLEELEKRYPSDQLTFVIGPDNLLNFAKFYKAEEILTRFCVLACPERVKVRSTDIRQRLQKGESIRELTTDRVAAMLSDLQLFSRSHD